MISTFTCMARPYHMQVNSMLCDFRNYNFEVFALNFYLSKKVAQKLNTRSKQLIEVQSIYA